MSITWNTLDGVSYGLQRWKLFVGLEESGNPKSTAYIDSKGIPTIGVGFNLRDPAVRDAVLQSLGFRYVENPDGSTKLIPSPEE